MNEETEINENIEAEEIQADIPAFEAPNKETFSFFDVLAERTYPTETVTVSLDEAAAYELSKLTDRLRELNKSEDSTDQDYQDIQNAADALKMRLDATKYTFHLRGVSDDRIADAMEAVDAKFEPKRVSRKKADGTLYKELPKSEAMPYARYLNAMTFALHIEQVVKHSNGAVMTAPGPDEIAAFFDQAPTAAQERIATAIHNLRIASGQYEASLDEGFFQKP